MKRLRSFLSDLSLLPAILTRAANSIRQQRDLDTRLAAWRSATSSSPPPDDVALYGTQVFHMARPFLPSKER